MKPIRWSFGRACVAIVALSVSQVSLAVTQAETFDGATFTNPFFVHTLEFDFCCWAIDIQPLVGGEALHLIPNTDTITFNLEPGESVTSISVDVLDFEGGFLGTIPSSFIRVESSSGEFTGTMVAEIGDQQTLTFDSTTLGVSGKPLGDIAVLQFQVANEGSAFFPFIGAYFDNITAEVSGGACTQDLDGDSVVGAADLAQLLGAWGACERDCAADFDGDGTIDAADLAQLLGSWGPC